MPTVVTLELKRTIEVIVPHRYPNDLTIRMVRDRAGDDTTINDIAVVSERTVTVEWAANQGPEYRLNDAGTALTKDEVEWIEGSQE